MAFGVGGGSERLTGKLFKEALGRIGELAGRVLKPENRVVQETHSAIGLKVGRVFAPCHYDPSERVARAVAEGAIPEASGMRGAASVPAFDVRLSPSARVEARPVSGNATFDTSQLRTLIVQDGDLVEVPFEEIAAARGKVQPEVRRLIDPEVTRKEMLEAIAVAEQSGSPRGAPLPEDGTLDPHTYFMAHVSHDPVSTSCIAQMADVGRVDGYRVVVLASPRDAAELRRFLTPRQLENVSILEDAAARKNVWFEDYATLTDQGELIIAPDVYERHGQEPFDAVGVGRCRDGVTYRMDSQGTVDKSHVREGAAVIAQATGLTLRVAEDFYNEDGNFVTGTLRNGEAFAFVGKDSDRISEVLAEEHAGGQLDAAELDRAMADDYGLNPMNLDHVEQLAEFHQDMRSLLVGPRVVVMHDSRGAAKLQADWWIDDYLAAQPKAPALPRQGGTPEETRAAIEAFRQARQEYQARFHCWQDDASLLETAIQRLMQDAEGAGGVEDMAYRQFLDQGYTVHRIPGVWPDYRPTNGAVAPEYEGKMNFYNAEQGYNEYGERFMSTQGGDPRAEQYFFRRLVRETGTDLHHVNLLKRWDTDKTLDMKGGLNCRVKADGTRLTPEALADTPWGG